MCAKLQNKDASVCAKQDDAMCERKAMLQILRTTCCQSLCKTFSISKRLFLKERGVGCGEVGGADNSHVGGATKSLEMCGRHTEGTSHRGLLTIAYYISYIGRVDVVACKASMPSRCG